MYHYKYILCFIVFFAICDASKKNPPLKQFEGPWTIRNASENALPILGNCPSMHIESSHNDPSTEGVIFFKSTIQKFTLTVVNVDQTIYQIFYPNVSGSGLLGNVSLMHAEKSAFIITELQTEGQIYYAVLTKENQTAPDTNKKIEKIWKSSKPSKNVSLAPIDYEYCPQEEMNSESNESSINPMVETIEAEQKKSSGNSGNISGREDTSVDKSTSDPQHPWVEEVKTTTGMKDATTDSISKTISPLSSSQTNPDKIKTLPILGGNDTTKKSKLKNSAESNILSSNLFTTTFGLLFFLVIKTILI